MKVEFYKHNVSETDIENVNKVLRSLWITTGGIVDEFESKFADYIGTKYCVGVTSCTAALHLSLLAYGIGKGSEVITTPMTFIATANSIIQAGARPIFVDVEPETRNINTDLVEDEMNIRTMAIMPVHLYGMMVDMVKIHQIADKRKIIVIEDAAHAIESNRDRVRVGDYGDVVCFSFYPTKSVTSGEGGAVCTNSKYIDEQLRMLRNHGMSKGAESRYQEKYTHWDMEIFGWKYNMSNIQAAMLLNQIDHIEENWQKRERICRIYEDAFKNNHNIRLMKVLPNSKSGRHLFTILVAPDKRDDILHKLQEKGIGVAVNYRAIHLLKYYRDTFGYKRGYFPVAELIGDSTITLPLYPKLTDLEVEYVIDGVKEAVN
jgi:dTDP-4-amino-4,6-dideoxygalactose transaminase